MFALYIFDTSTAPKLSVNNKLLGDLTTEEHTNSDSIHVKWLLPDSKLERWSQFDSLHSQFGGSSYSISQLRRNNKYRSRFQIVHGSRMRSAISAR